MNELDILERIWKIEELLIIWNNTKYKLQNAGIKMPFIPRFYSVLMSTSIKVHTNHLEAF